MSKTKVDSHEIHTISSTTKELIMNCVLLMFATLIISGNAIATEVRERPQEQMQIQQQEQIRENHTEQDRLREQERIRSEQSAKDQERMRYENNERMQEHERHQERSIPENPSFRGGNFGSGRGQGGGGRNR